MITKDALEFLLDRAGATARDGVKLAQDTVHYTPAYHKPVYVTPDGSLLPLEHVLPHRVRPRGCYKTNDFESFANYVRRHEANVPIFVDDTKLVANCILNPTVGNLQGHCDYTAQLTTVHDPLFALVMSARKGIRLTQREMIDFLSDLRTVLVFATDDSGASMDFVQAARIIASVTVDSIKTQESQINGHNEQQSTLAATVVKQRAPTMLCFNCAPLQGFDFRVDVNVRLVITAGDKGPVFSLAVVTPAVVDREIAKHLVLRIKEELGTACDVLIGSFDPGT